MSSILLFINRFLFFWSNMAPLLHHVDFPPPPRGLQHSHDHVMMVFIWTRIHQSNLREIWTSLDHRMWNGANPKQCHLIFVRLTQHKLFKQGQPVRLDRSCQGNEALVCQAPIKNKNSSCSKRP